VRLVEAHRVRISGRTDEPVQVDGDIGAHLPCEIAVRREAVRLVYPAPAPVAEFLPSVAAKRA
jgi:diacylglycerol kinase family enzyme